MLFPARIFKIYRRTYFGEKKSKVKRRIRFFVLEMATTREVWLIDVNNVRGKCGFPPLADFCRNLESWAKRQGENSLVVLAIDCGLRPESFTLSPHLAVAFSGIGREAKDADTIIAHASDHFLRSTAAVVRVVTSDHLLRNRCRHELPAPPQVVKPLGPLRQPSQLSRLRLEVRSESFSGRLHQDAAAHEEALSYPGDAFGRALPSSRRTNRKGAIEDENGKARMAAASAMHEALQKWASSNDCGRTTPLGPPVAAWSQWFRLEYLYSPKDDPISESVEGGSVLESSNCAQAPSQLQLQAQWSFSQSIWALVVQVFERVFAAFLHPAQIPDSSAVAINETGTIFCFSNSPHQPGGDHGATPKASGSSVPVTVLEFAAASSTSSRSLISDWGVNIDLGADRFCGVDELTITCVSDTHSFEQSWTRVPPADVLIHCGDYSNDYRGEENLDKWLHAQPHAIKIVLKGNHDDPKRGGLKMLPLSRALLVGGSPHLFSIAGVRFLALPWNQARDGGGKRSKSWLGAPLPQADVVLSHAPPRGILDCNQLGTHIGSRSLLGAVASAGCADASVSGFGSTSETEATESVRPPILWCFGHVHECRGAKHVNLRTAQRLKKGAAKSSPPYSAESTLCINASNANDGRASCWPSDRPPLVLKLQLSVGAQSS